MKLSDLTATDEIICRSEKEWERIAKLLHAEGYKWNDGDDYWPLRIKWDYSPFMVYCLDGSYYDHSELNARSFNIPRKPEDEVWVESTELGSSFQETVPLP